MVASLIPRLNGLGMRIGGGQPHSQTTWAGNEAGWCHTVGSRATWCGLEECQCVSSYVANMVDGLKT